MRKRRTNPFLFTTIGAVIGGLAVVAFMATLTHCSSGALAAALFPLCSLATEVPFINHLMSTPVLCTGALLHWPAVGAVVDLAIAWKRRSQRAKRPKRVLMD